MKAFTLLITLLILVSSQAIAKSADIYVPPSMSGKVDIMEELGLVDHVDPVQYRRLQKRKIPMKPIAKKSEKQKTHAREVAGIAE